jgi:Concanavalin A-like lectin/glucanases superfamily
MMVKSLSAPQRVRGGISTLYVNGVPSGGSSSGSAFPQGNFALGAPPQSPTSQFFTGLIDEVRVFTFAPGQFRTSDLLLKSLDSDADSEWQRSFVSQTSDMG